MTNTKAPERIWLWRDGDRDFASRPHMPYPEDAEPYVHLDLLTAAEAERDEAAAMKDALVGDKIMLRSELAAVEAERDRLAALLEDAKGALEKIERWDDFPATGEFWPSGNPVSYTAQYGSVGARDFMRSIARATLAKLDKEKTDDQD